MFFVFYSIDVLFLNNEKRIIEIKENFRPFTFYTSTSDKVMYVIELPKNTIKSTKIRLGDQLELPIYHSAQ